MLNVMLIMCLYIVVGYCELVVLVLVLIGICVRVVVWYQIHRDDHPHNAASN